MKSSVRARFFILIFGFSIFGFNCGAAKQKITFVQCLSTDGEWVSARFMPTGFIIDDARKACQARLGDKWAGQA